MGLMENLDININLERDDLISELRSMRDEKNGQSIDVLVDAISSMGKDEIGVFVPVLCVALDNDYEKIPELLMDIKDVMSSNYTAVGHVFNLCKSLKREDLVEKYVIYLTDKGFAEMYRYRAWYLFMNNSKEDKKQYEESMKWYLKAKETGCFSYKDRYNLASVLKALGDCSKALKIFELVKSYCPIAYMSIGNIYLEDNDVPYDINKAAENFQLAANYGVEGAKEKLEQIKVKQWKTV